MENPYEQQQSALLIRIVTNVKRLNQTMTDLNQKLETLNRYNSDVVLIADMWSAYNESVRIHLDNTKALDDPNDAKHTTI
ncbi:DASH complex subunit dad4 [Mycotypha africana]|uniref:DASH complex subunit dad4 n=1 Tax=Mycotypha africana TaxID=64632 RepID=UPI0022FFFE8E|nr:DASH complex subunit dad4 [Mycotypha africana]KAI8991311.1 DASH complex subunit dad4 [Mycotypha africana]